MSLDGLKFVLGPRGGRLVACGATSPIPPSPHHFVLETFAEGSCKTLKVIVTNMVNDVAQNTRLNVKTIN